MVKNAKVGMQEQQKAVKIHGEDMRKAQEKIPKGKKHRNIEILQEID